MRRIIIPLTLLISVSCNQDNNINLPQFDVHIGEVNTDVEVGKAIEIPLRITGNSVSFADDFYINFIISEGKGKVTSGNGEELFTRFTYSLTDLAPLYRIPSGIGTNLFFTPTESGKFKLLITVTDNRGTEKTVEAG